MKEEGHDAEEIAISTRAVLLAEEFRARHAEILHYLQEAKQIVFWCLAASAAIWAWVVENKCDPDAKNLMSFIIFVPLLVSIYCGFRWTLLEHYVGQNATYVQQNIDQHLLPALGWETYLQMKHQKDYSGENQVNLLQRYNRYMAIALWFLLVSANTAGIFINHSTRCEKPQGVVKQSGKKTAHESRYLFSNSLHYRV